MTVIRDDSRYSRAEIDCETVEIMKTCLAAVNGYRAAGSAFSARRGASNDGLAHRARWRR